MIPERQASSGSPADDIANAAAEGYELIGVSAYNGPAAGQMLENWQAKKGGATLVISSVKFTGMDQAGSITSTTYTRRGSFGFDLPINVAHYDEVILFFVRNPHLGTGIYAQVLKPGEHTELGTNKGVKAVAIIRGSPAFAAEVLPGDIILSVNGEAVYDPTSFDAAVRSAYGSTANLAIARTELLSQRT